MTFSIVLGLTWLILWWHLSRWLLRFVVLQLVSSQFKSVRRK